MAVQWSNMFFQCHVVEKIFQNLRVRLKFSIRWAIKIKHFVAREIRYFELAICSFNSYVCYLTRGFIASTCAFNLPSRAFNLARVGCRRTPSECFVPFSRMLSALFCPLFHFKIITLLRVFYNFTKFLHNFI